jgi:hypothetical protein
VKITSVSAIVSVTAPRSERSRTISRTAASTSGSSVHARPSGQPTKNASIAQYV